MITKAELKALIDRIKSVTGKTQREISLGASYKENSLSELVAQKNGNYEPVYRQLELVYGEILKNSIRAPERDSHNPKTAGQHFTADQLFAMFMEVAKTQTAILNNIESKMAREETQARIDANLSDVLQVVNKLSEGQNVASTRLLKEILALQRDRSPSSAISKKKAGNGAGE